MDSTQIKDRLLQEGYNQNNLEDTISYLLSLGGDPKIMFERWLKENVKVEFNDIQGIDDKFLREKLQMKEPAIVIAYSMLIDSPEENSLYFRELANNRIEFHPITT